MRAKNEMINALATWWRVKTCSGNIFLLYINVVV